MIVSTTVESLINITYQIDFVALQIKQKSPLSMDFHVI